MLKLQTQISQWADKLIPPKDRTIWNACTKLVMEEIPELLMDVHQDGKPSEEEVADVLILALDIATLCGYNAKEIVEKKMRINMDRKWDIKNGVLKHR